MLYSFGGPDGPEDVMPFLRNVTRGKNTPDERLGGGGPPPPPGAGPAGGRAPGAGGGEEGGPPPRPALPYDALMLYSFGGPDGPEDVMPFLRNVTRGKNTPDERLAEVGEHYHLFG